MARNEELYVDLSQPSSFEELAKMNLGKRPVRGIVQPPVKPPVWKPRRYTNLLMFMLDVVSAICKHPNSWPFKKPVDTLYLNIPDYHEIIKHPMDLFTIRQRIQNFFYYDANECIKDIRLLFYDCYLYNGHDSEIGCMAKTLENTFVEEMTKCPEKEVEVPIPIKTSKRKRRNVKTKTCHSKALKTYPSFPVEGNSKPNQWTTTSLSLFEPTSQTYLTAFIPNSTVMQFNKMNKSSQQWTCPGCGYHSESPQNFMQKPQVVEAQHQSAQSSKIPVCEHSSSCSSDSSSSSSDFEKGVEKLEDKIKKLTEALEYVVKDFNEDKKRKMERRNKRQLKIKLSHAPKQRIEHNNESPLVAAFPVQSVSTTTSSNNTLNKNQKQTQKNSSNHIHVLKPSGGIKETALKCNSSPNPEVETTKSALKFACSPKSVAGTKTVVLKRACSPKLQVEIKKRKANCNLPNRQTILEQQTPLTASRCLSPPPMSMATPNGGFKIKIEKTDLKPLPPEEKRELGEDLLKLGDKEKMDVPTVIKRKEPSVYAAANEMEIDVETLKPSTSRELQQYVNNLKKETKYSGCIDKNEPNHQTCNTSTKKEIKQDDDDDTSSTTSTSSNSSSSSSSDSDHSLLVIPDKNTSNIGKKNSVANFQSTATTSGMKTAPLDSTTSPLKVNTILSKPNPAISFSNLQQPVIKKEPYHPYPQEFKPPISDPSTSRSILPQNSYTRDSLGSLKNRIGTISTLDVGQLNGYTRITKRVGQTEKKAQFDPEHQRFIEIVENAKKTMKMRENARNQVQKQTNDLGTGKVEIKKEPYRADAFMKI